MLGSLGWTWTTVGPVASYGCCASLQNKRQRGSIGASPVAAPMPKSVSF